VKKIYIILLLVSTYILADTKVLDINHSIPTQVKGENNLTQEANTTIVDSPETIALKRRKLNILIGQFNYFSVAVYHVYPYYQRYFGTNPNTYKKTLSGYLLELFQNVDKSMFERAKNVDILHNLDEMIDNYYASAINIKKLHNEAYEYYNMKDYINDKHAKAKQMHKPLLTAYDTFFEADKVLKSKVEEVQDVLDIQYFKVLKEQGNQFAYIKGMALHESKVFLRSIRNKKIAEINFNKIKTLLSHIRGYYDELKVLKTKDEKIYNTQDYHYSFYNALQAYTIAAKDMTFRVKEKRPYGKYEIQDLSGTGAWMVRSSVGDVSHKYNKLVQAYNGSR